MPWSCEGSAVENVGVGGLGFRFWSVGSQGVESSGLTYGPRRIITNIILR